MENRELLPASLTCLQPYIKLIRPQTHAILISSLKQLNQQLNILNSQQNKKHITNNKIMIIESEHPYSLANNKKYTATFNDNIKCVTIQFDIRTQFINADDHILIGFPEDPNFFFLNKNILESQTHNVIIVPSNIVHIHFAPMGNNRATDMLTADDYCKQWGFRMFLKPYANIMHIEHEISRVNHTLQMSVCHILSQIASSIIIDDCQIPSEIRFPSPVEFYSSSVFKNGLEHNIVDEEQKDGQLDQFLCEMMDYEEENKNSDVIGSKNSSEIGHALNTIQARFPIANALKTTVEFPSFNISFINEQNEMKANKDDECISITLPGIYTSFIIHVNDDNKQPMSTLENTNINVRFHDKKILESEKDKKNWNGLISWSYGPPLSV